MMSRQAAISKIARFIQGDGVMLKPLSVDEAEDLRYALEVLLLPGWDSERISREGIEEYIEEVVR